MPVIFKETKVEREIRNHYPIKVSLWSSFKLFFIRPCRCNDYKWLKNNGKVTQNERLVRLYNKGWAKLHNDFGLDRIIKKLRDIKLLVKAKHMDDRDAFCIQHHGRNIIYLDDPNDITSD